MRFLPCPNCDRMFELSASVTTRLLQCPSCGGRIGVATPTISEAEAIKKLHAKRETVFEHRTCLHS